jgi:hypothetical protein
VKGQKTTPEKPPPTRIASIAGGALPKGKATKKDVQSMAGRIESERAAAKSKSKKK